MSVSAAVTLERIRQRDPEAVGELVRQHHRALRGYVAALCADPARADDISQDVFLRALERLERVDDLHDFARFLRGIARNVVREHQRGQRRHSKRYTQFVEERFEPTAPAEAPAVVPGEPIDDAPVSALRRCVEQLTAKAQRMLRLRYAEERHAEEIGLEMELNAGAVRVALLRIRETLLKCLRASGHSSACRSAATYKEGRA